MMNMFSYSIPIPIPILTVKSKCFVIVTLKPEMYFGSFAKHSFNGHKIFYKHAASAVSIYSPIKSLVYQTRLITWKHHHSTCRRHKTLGTSHRPRERNELMFVKFRRRTSRQQQMVPLGENAECVHLKQQMSWKFFLNEFTMLIKLMATLRTILKPDQNESLRGKQSFK